jgi:hypothetical protein
MVGQSLKHSIFIVSLAIVLVSCNGTMSMREPPDSAKQESVQQYLETAGHLNNAQRQAMEDGKPFVGMTYEEATLAMILVDFNAKFDGKFLKAVFKDRMSRSYILFFDGGTPSRVKTWNAFTDEEVEEFSTFRDVHPRPPDIQPLHRQK